MAHCFSSFLRRHLRFWFFRGAVLTGIQSFLSFLNWILEDSSSLKLTASLHLKMDGTGRLVSFCRIVVMSGFFREVGSPWSWWKVVRNFSVSQNGSLTPQVSLPKANMTSWKIHHEWRCISYWKWGFSNVMLDFWKWALPQGKACLPTTNFQGRLLLVSDSFREGNGISWMWFTRWSSISPHFEIPSVPLVSVSIVVDFCDLLEDHMLEDECHKAVVELRFFHGSSLFRVTG